MVRRIRSVEVVSIGIAVVAGPASWIILVRETTVEGACRAALVTGRIVYRHLFSSIIALLSEANEVSRCIFRVRVAPGARQGLQARGLAQGRARGQAGSPGSWFGSGSRQGPGKATTQSRRMVPLSSELTVMPLPAE